jgi:hypothetical protein
MTGVEIGHHAPERGEHGQELYRRLAFELRLPLPARERERRLA